MNVNMIFAVEWTTSADEKGLKKFKLPLDWATNPNLFDGRMQQDILYNILPSYPNVKPEATLG